MVGGRCKGFGFWEVGGIGHTPHFEGCPVGWGGLQDWGGGVPTGAGLVDRGIDPKGLGCRRGWGGVGAG